TSVYLFFHTLSERMFVRCHMNLTEKHIYKFYQSMNIHEPELLFFERITEFLNMKLIYWPHTSSIAEHDNRYIVFINESINEQQQWQEFGHEMSHYFNDRINRKSVND